MPKKFNFLFLVFIISNYSQIFAAEKLNIIENNQPITYTISADDKAPSVKSFRYRLYKNGQYAFFWGRFGVACHKENNGLACISREEPYNEGKNPLSCFYKSVDKQGMNEYSYDVNSIKKCSDIPDYKNILDKVKSDPANSIYGGKLEDL